METLLIAAFLAGVLTIASPCVLMVLPIVLSTSNTGGRLRPLGIVLGFAASFTAFTLAFAGALQALALPVSWLRTFTVVALAVFGLALLVPAVGRIFERAFSPVARLANTNTQRSGFGGGLLIGSGLGLLWTPCAGPLLAAAIALTASVGISPEGVAITLMYTLGAGIPMLLIAYGSRSLAARAKRIGRNTGILQRMFGALTLVACLAILFGVDTKIQGYVQSNLSSGWSRFLTAFDTQPAVQSELDKLMSKPSLPVAALPTSAPALTGSQPVVAAPTNEPIMEDVPVPTTAPTEVPPTPKPAIALEDRGPAPELTGLTQWFNSKPLTIKELKGKVVIVDFWTFACYNCQNTRPYVRALYDKYKDQGLVILGIHTPEFGYEKVPENVKSAAKDQGVTWPIALDPDFKTWRAYSNRYWPAFYFIDANGHLRYSHFGEGNYEYNEKVVQQLLSEAKSAQK
jgi:cytochrome c biogenesis protein CcdA/thiol-disulfide isomerase/thioredoxin